MGSERIRGMGEEINSCVVPGVCAVQILRETERRSG
ncbi:hypothetical protein COLO4_25455 [Corchorus olitorius]|uniref:Uncharacterized protein n=1 Tax=Corchorus olitorius TaxID=93759 RepID=A0A1R3I2G3_9ROSI|nr:hypothetical protein COLO4_25455 [Corchorus olitorius]